ncbi:MAG: hypothetical protein ACJ762_07445 [Solirubrobacteraceae bacterium]
MLLLLALRDAQEALDAGRLQTGMFLLSQEAELPEDSIYEFSPQEPGPFSATIYSDLAALEEANLIAREQVPGFSWSEFVTTELGMERAQSLVTEMDEMQLGALRSLAAIKQNILSQGFRDLLDHLHRLYPEFTAKSVFH